jgi:hypothetical protein
MIMERSPFLQQIGRNVDQLVTIDLPSYGVIDPLYAGAVEIQGSHLCLQAAELLDERVHPGATVILLTGLILPGHHPHGETDGPLGAAVLARALALGLSARVLVAIEPELTGLMTELLKVAGLDVVTEVDLERRDGTSRPVAAVSALSRSRPEAQAQTASWIEKLQVSAVLAIEKAGANAQGIYHMVGGMDITDKSGKGEAVFAEASAQGLLRIGIGDRGNELGMGPISQVTREILPFGRDCKCPCHGGVADETAADLAIPAVISNWGAYGIVACLAAIKVRPDLLHSAEMERRLLEAAISAGAIDGMSGRARLAVDGIGLATSVGIVELLSEIYRAQSVRDPSPFSTPIITQDHKGSQSIEL